MTKLSFVQLVLLMLIQTVDFILVDFPLPRQQRSAVTIRIPCRCSGSHGLTPTKLTLTGRNLEQDP